MRRKVIQSDITKFEDFLNNDTEFRRFPARFILLNDLESWKKVIDILRSYCDIKIRLSEYSLSNDALPDLNRAIEDTKKHLFSGNTVLLYPLSEVLRFTGENYSYSLSKLANIEIDPKSSDSRLYIPLLEDSTFNSFWEKFKMSVKENTQQLK